MILVIAMNREHFELERVKTFGARMEGTHKFYYCLIPREVELFCV